MFVQSAYSVKNYYIGYVSDPRNKTDSTVQILHTNSKKQV